MKTVFAAACGIALFATPALADPLASGGSVTYAVPGTTSIYQVFGHDGSPGGGGTATDAVQTTFSAGANTFTFTASGLISCCSNAADTSPDGGGSSMNVGGANGLSSLSGNHNIPLVGVFTTDTDPFGGAAPAPLSFDGNNPTGLSPLLNQVFYIGDGKAGYNNAAGALLQFIAPLTATRLYLGTIDASGFNNPTGFYADNHGSFSVTVDLAAVNGAVPELGTWAMMLVGFGAIGTLMRRRRQIKPAHA